MNTLLFTTYIHHKQCSSVPPLLLLHLLLGTGKPTNEGEATSSSQRRLRLKEAAHSNVPSGFILGGGGRGGSSTLRCLSSRAVFLNLMDTPKRAERTLESSKPLDYSENARSAIPVNCRCFGSTVTLFDHCHSFTLLTESSMD